MRAQSCVKDCLKHKLKYTQHTHTHANIAGVGGLKHTNDTKYWYIKYWHSLLLNDVSMFAKSELEATYKFPDLIYLPVLFCLATASAASHQEH